MEDEIPHNSQIRGSERPGLELNRAFCSWHYPLVCARIFTLGCSECPLVKLSSCSASSASTDDPNEIYLEDGISLADLICEIGGARWEGVKEESESIRLAMNDLTSRLRAYGHMNGSLEVPPCRPAHSDASCASADFGDTARYFAEQLAQLEDFIGLHERNKIEDLTELLEGIGAANAEQMLQVFMFMREHLHALGCFKRLPKNYFHISHDQDSAADLVEKAARDREEGRENALILALVGEALKSMQHALGVWKEMDWIHTKDFPATSSSVDQSMRATATNSEAAATFMLAALVGALTPMTGHEDMNVVAVDVLDQQAPQNAIEAAVRAQQFVCSSSMLFLYRIWPDPESDLLAQQKHLLNNIRRVEMLQSKELNNNCLKYGA